MINDKKLIKQYLAGDKEAFEVLVKRHLKPVYGFIYRRVGGVQDAEDVTQEVFVRAWRNLNRFDQSKSFRTWVFSIAKNASIDFFKKRKTLLFTDFIGEEDKSIFEETIRDTSPLPDELSNIKNIGRALATALNTLSPKHKRVFDMRYGGDLSFREIAETLGEPLHTVKSRYRRALISLRKIIPSGVYQLFY